MFKSGLLTSQRTRFRTTSGDNPVNYIYNGILDISGNTGHGLFGDSKDQTAYLFCNSVFTTTQCVTDSYGNPIPGTEYRIFPNSGSAAAYFPYFRKRQVDQGFVITQDGSRYFGFREVSSDGGNGPTNYVVSCVGCSNSGSTYIGGGSFGTQYIMAIKFDGTLWGWGYNGYGNLGTNNSTNYSSPVQIGSSTDWATVQAGVDGSYTIALKTDGTLWAWGYNLDGRLGDNSTTTRSSPVQIGSDTWKHISTGYYHTLALKTDGTLWSWGVNDYGQLGDNSTTNRSSPVQIGSDTDWAFPMARYLGSYVIKQNNIMWNFGYNGGYALGIGDFTHRSSPVQMGSKTWKIGPSVASYRILESRQAIDTDGKMWVWGASPAGVANIGNRISPIQVGTATDHVIFPHISNIATPFINTSGSLQHYNSYDSNRESFYAAYGNSSVGLKYGTVITYQGCSNSTGARIMLKSGTKSRNL